jgi:hypothetical protein
VSADPAERVVGAAEDQRPRRRFLLEESDFDEVPPKYRRFYRHWKGADDELAANEVLCPVCKVVIRSTRELRAGDRLYCMACMTRLRVRVGQSGRLEADCEY